MDFAIAKGLEIWQYPAATPALIFAESGTSFGPRERGGAEMVKKKLEMRLADWSLIPVATQ